VKFAPVHNLRMNDPILFSIVVPTYNRVHLISSTIESILAQTYQDYEIIIVDDGSTDHTEEVIQKFLSDKVHYYKTENAERAAARNYGTSKAKGDYINWFDSDDIMMPNHLEEAANLISKYNRPEIFAQGFLYKNTSGEVIQLYKYPENINKAMYRGNPIANSPVIVRRDIALANLFNEDRGLSVSEDYELWLRLAAKYHIYTSPEITLAIVDHEQRSTLTMSDEHKLIIRYTKFINYAISDQGVLALLGKHKNNFVMKNYLMLAVILAVNGHLKTGWKYFLMACSSSPAIILERGFYAFIKYNIKHILPL
jgi:glycosyltransferase involved in cell wall biosynthesis